MILLLKNNNYLSRKVYILLHLIFLFKLKDYRKMTRTKKEKIEKENNEISNSPTAITNTYPDFISFIDDTGEKKERYVLIKEKASYGVSFMLGDIMITIPWHRIFKIKRNIKNQYQSVSTAE